MSDEPETGFSFQPARMAQATRSGQQGVFAEDVSLAT